MSLSSPRFSFCRSLLCSCSFSLEICSCRPNVFSSSCVKRAYLILLFLKVFRFCFRGSELRVQTVELSELAFSVRHRIFQLAFQCVCFSLLFCRFVFCCLLLLGDELDALSQAVSLSVFLVEVAFEGQEF